MVIGEESLPGRRPGRQQLGAFMNIHPSGQQLAQSASHSRALATLSGDDSQQGSWDQQVSLSSQVLTGKAQQVLTYEHLARSGKSASLAGSANNTVVQQLVDKALGFDRKKFDDLESQIKGLADNKTLSAEERETQTRALTEQRDAMLKAAMDRLTGKSSSGQSAQA